MLIPLLILLIWTIAAVGYFASYHRLNRPVPRSAVAVLVTAAFILAILSMVRGGTLWQRCVVAALWLVAAAGLLLLWLRSRNRRASATRTAPSFEGLPGNVSDLTARLEASGFAVRMGAGPEAEGISLVAQKACFDATRLQLVETFFMVQRFDCVDERELNTYANLCATYAASHRKVRLPWLHMVHIAVFYPIAASLRVDSGVAQNISSRPPMIPGWWGLGLPIIWDLANERLYYSQASSEWPDTSGFVWDLMRQTAAGILGGQNSAA